MAKPLEDKPLKPTVLDRLVGLVGTPTSSGYSSGQSFAQLRQSVKRDLENLLNTRWRCSSWPPNQDELENSLVNYGIPDFTGANMGSTSDREDFRAIIERAIKFNEPRFVSVKVVLIENDDKADRTLRFRIDAEIHAVPNPEPIVFDTSMEPATHRFRITKTER